VEIRIHGQPCRGINLTTQHMRARRATQVVTVDDVVKEKTRAYLTLVHIFHANASMDNLWVAHALSLLGIHEVW
jgi:hypothetical protein